MWGQMQYCVVGLLEQVICLEVFSGVIMCSVGNCFDGQGVFSSWIIFNVGVDYLGKVLQLKVGWFIVFVGLLMEEIVEIVIGDGVSNCGKQIFYCVGVNCLIVEVCEINLEINCFDEIVWFVVGEDEVFVEFECVVNEVGIVFCVVIVEGVISWQVYIVLNVIDVLGEDVMVILSEGSFVFDSYEFMFGDSV